MFSNTNPAGFDTNLAFPDIDFSTDVRKSHQEKRRGYSIETPQPFCA